MFIDLHIHSTASDGTDSPKEIVEKISRKDGIKIFALTDHDTIAGIEKLPADISDKIFFINGVEFSCKTADGVKCHILAYFFNADNEEFQMLLRNGSELRKVQFEKRLKYLSEKYGITFTESDIAEICKSNIVGKPHIVNFAAQKFGFDKDQLYKDLRKCSVGSARQDAASVIKAVKNSGGIAVWAHPLGGEGEPILSQDEFKARLHELCNFGIQGLECYYSRYTNEQEKFLAESARENKFLISGGSDYHGLNKNIALGTLGTESPDIKIYQLTILQKIFEQHKISRIRQAFKLAKIAHEGQTDKAGVEYIYHPMTVAFQCGGNISAMIVALLHDVAEDTNLSVDDLQKKISLTDEEIHALKLLTHDEKISYFDYVQNISADELARQVKIADLKHNSDLSRIPKEVQTSKDFKRVEKYKQALKILRGD